MSNTTHYNECALCSIKPPISGNNKLPNAEASISYGKYTYKEIFAPEGYLLNEEMFVFEIKGDGQIIKHTVKDQKKTPPPTPETTQKLGQPEAPQPPQPLKVTEKPVISQLETPQ